MKNSQKGFTVAEILLVVVLAGLVSGVGWYVWQANQKKNTSVENPYPKSPAVSDKYLITKADEADRSKPNAVRTYEGGRFGSAKGAFSIRLADGLDGLNDTTTDLFVFRKFTANTGAPILKDVDGYGSDGVHALLIYQADKMNLYTEANKVNSQVAVFTTDKGVKGTRVSYQDPYEPPCNDPGCRLGTKHVVYDFENSGNGKVTRVAYSRLVANEETKKVYSVTADDPDFTAAVDAMVKTLEIY
jgi:hypothetical protein